MKILGLLLMFVSIILMIVGIASTTAIHEYNRTHLDQPRSDLFSIISGIAGATFIIVGFAMFMRLKKKKSP